MPLFNRSAVPRYRLQRIVGLATGRTTASYNLHAGIGKEHLLIQTRAFQVCCACRGCPFSTSRTYHVNRRFLQAEHKEAETVFALARSAK